MKKWLGACVLLLLAFGGYAQPELGSCDQEKVKLAEDQIPKALKAYRAKNAQEIRRYLGKALKFQEDNADALFLMGDIAFREGKVTEAEGYWMKLLDVCPDYKADVQFFVGMIYHGKGRFDKALPLLQAYLVHPERDPELVKEAKAVLKEVELKAQLSANPIDFNPHPVSGISTEWDEYLGCISPDGELAFFTRKIKRSNKYGGPANSARLVEEFTLATKQANGFERGEPLKSPFNEEYNEGGPTITANNREMFFTICTPDASGYKNCDIYTSKMEYGTWGRITPLSAPINFPNSWESQPSVGANGEVLYFASDREGGKGGLDIYLCRRQPDGTWSTPENLGSVVNTAGNEKTPFIHSDSQTLYFTSDRHPGMGGYDIFLVKNSGSAWETPINLGFPINTEADELGLFVSLDGRKAYFSSNSLKNSKGGWDLFEFDLPEPLRPEKVALIKGELQQENGLGSGTELEIKNLKTKEIKRIAVDEQTGSYAAVVTLKPKEDFLLTVKQEGSAFSSKYVDADDGSLEGEVVTSNLEVKEIKVGEEYRINDINFPSNSSELDDVSLAVIEAFKEFLDAHPGVKVDIQGHTDDVGNDADNLKLSQDRARVVYETLIKMGVKAQRMQHHGYGENRPIASNQSEEGRAQNRRTIFVITSN